MENTISTLLACYENGGLSRRDLVRGLALLAGRGVRGSRAAGFQGSSIDHVSLSVSDLKASGDFYARVFGGSAKSRPDRSVAVSLGKEPRGAAARGLSGRHNRSFRDRRRSF